MVGMFFMSLFGKTVVRIAPQQGTVFTGIGVVGLHKHFHPLLVSEVRLVSKDIYDDGMKQTQQQIVL